MPTSRRLTVATLAFTLAAASHASVARATSPIASLVAAAVSADAAAATAASVELRALGPAGLKALLDANAAAVDRARSGAALPADWERLHDALDRVAAQRDAYASGLYWYTDLSAAERAASAETKPILALRLLGRLDEELSCANSRFFRTALYANAEISRYLAEYYVLYWSSERPVPVVTVDYGDGRVLRTTVTGNSVHYVLDAKGRVVDALPGLYGPKAFLRALAEAERDARELAPLDGAARNSELKRRAENRIDDASRELAEREQRLPQASAVQGANVLAAGELTTVSKSAVEIRLVDSIFAPSRDDSKPWARMAAETPGDAKLDAGGRAMVRRHVAPEFARPDGSIDEEGVEATVRAFERDMAVDTLRNRLKYRPEIAAFVVADPAGTLESLNRLVYEQVFVMPADPWYGLRAPTTYSALEAAGVERREP